MKKIIKENMPNTYMIICNRCGTKFIYEDEDIFELPNPQVECPACKHHNIHLINRDNISTIHT